MGTLEGLHYGPCRTCLWAARMVTVTPHPTNRQGGASGSTGGQRGWRNRRLVRQQQLWLVHAVLQRLQCRRQVSPLEHPAFRMILGYD
jgi:hypothetical protein